MRIAILGSPGSGKTSLARRLSTDLDVVHIEIDAMFHQPGWQPKPSELMRSEMIELLDTHHQWVVDGNYNGVLGDIVQRRADTIVIFDLPRALVMRQVVRRTLRRTITRQELWNGNREPWSNLTRLAPEKNIIRWAWVHHPRYAREYRDKRTSGHWAHAEVVVLTSHADTDAWLASLRR